MKPILAFFILFISSLSHSQKFTEASSKVFNPRLVELHNNIARDLNEGKIAWKAIIKIADKGAELNNRGVTEKNDALIKSGQYQIQQSLLKITSFWDHTITPILDHLIAAEAEANHAGCTTSAKGIKILRSECGDINEMVREFYDNAQDFAYWRTIDEVGAKGRKFATQSSKLAKALTAFSSNFNDANFAKYCMVSKDYKAKRIVKPKNTSVKVTNMSYDTGIKVKQGSNRTFVVSSVDQLKSGYNAGIRNGDQIIAIDDLEVTGYLASQMQNWLGANNPNKHIKVKYQSKSTGQIDEVLLSVNDDQFFDPSRLAKKSTQSSEKIDEKKIYGKRIVEHEASFESKYKIVKNQEAIDCVISFLTLKDQGGISKDKKAMLLPDITENLEKYGLNTYGSVEYKIEGFENGYVLVYVFNQKRSFTHRLYFKVVEKEDRFYILCTPFKKGSKLVDPWLKIDKNITINKEDLYPSLMGN